MNQPIPHPAEHEALMPEPLEARFQAARDEIAGVVDPVLDFYREQGIPEEFLTEGGSIVFGVDESRWGPLRITTYTGGLIELRKVDDSLSRRVRGGPVYNVHYGDIPSEPDKLSFASFPPRTPEGIALNDPETIDRAEHDIALAQEVGGLIRSGRAKILRFELPVFNIDRQLARRRDLAQQSQPTTP